MKIIEKRKLDLLWIIIEGKRMEGLKEYKNEIEKIKAGIEEYKDHCAHFNPELNERDGESCWEARKGLNKIHYACRRAAIIYGRNEESTRTINKEFGDLFQTVISHYAREHHDYGCRKGECEATPSAVIDLKPILEEVERGNKISSEGEGPGFSNG